MSAGTKVVLAFCLVLAGVVLFQHASRAVNPPLPSDMPSDARFIATGYDLEHNERKGTWVACQPDAGGDTFCRVTDAQGIVIFQGDYLPVRDSQSVSDGGTNVDPSESTIRWVQAPLEGTSVPLIPMSDGSWLVPGLDRDALVNRWNRNPDEWQTLMAH